MKAMSLQLMTKDIERHCYMLSLDINVLNYCIFQRLDLFYEITPLIIQENA